MNRLALTERRKMDCDGYLFPADYYEIPGVEEFQNVEAVRNHAFEKLKSCEKGLVDLYLNGGLSVESGRDPGGGQAGHPAEHVAL